VLGHLNPKRDAIRSWHTASSGTTTTLLRLNASCPCLCSAVLSRLSRPQPLSAWSAGKYSWALRPFWRAWAGETAYTPPAR